MQERRKHPRKKVTEPLTVYDLDRERVVGYLVDISLEGLMVLTQDPLPANRVLRLSLTLPAGMAPDVQAEFGAETLWREPSNTPGHFWIGMHIIDISPQTNAQLVRLIDEYL